MGWIHLENMEFYAYHGHFKEEQVVGNKFLVNLDIKTDISKAAKTDDLEDALNYQQVYDTVKKQMEVNSSLLEHIANRIINALYESFEDKIQKIILRVSKLNPPLSGKVQRVSISIER